MSDPKPEDLHDRARQSAANTRQLVIGLATASIAFYYGAIFKDWCPVLSGDLKLVLLSGMACMGFAVFAGILGSFADAQWNYWWAKQVEFSSGDALRLMSVNATDDLEDKGKDLIIVALVDTVLHIRIFDASGQKVFDKTENDLVGRKTMTALKQRLTPFPAESSLSQKDKLEILGNATSNAGYTRWIEVQVLGFMKRRVTLEMLKRYWDRWQALRRGAEAITFLAFLLGVLLACWFVFERA